MVSRLTQLLVGALALCVAIQFFRLGHLHSRLGAYDNAGPYTKGDELASLQSLVAQMRAIAARDVHEKLKSLELGSTGGAGALGPLQSSLAQARHLSQLAGDASRLLDAIQASAGDGATANAGSRAGAGTWRSNAGGAAGTEGADAKRPNAATTVDCDGGSGGGAGVQRSTRPEAMAGVAAAASRWPSRVEHLKERIRELHKSHGVALVTEAEALSHSGNIDLVAARASHGLRNVLVTYANIHSKELALNWLWHVVSLDVSNFLLLAMDADMRDLCVSLGVPVYLMEMSRGDEGNKSLLAHVAEKDKAHLTQYDLLRLDHNAFRRMGMLKCDILLQLLTTGHDALFSDTDTVWMRNPWPYFDSTSPTADILVSTDCLSHVRDEGLVLPKDAVLWDRCGHVEGRTFGTALNTGMLFVRATGGSRRFVERWKQGVVRSFARLRARVRVFRVFVVDIRGGTGGATGIRAFRSGCVVVKDAFRVFKAFVIGEGAGSPPTGPISFGLSPGRKGSNPGGCTSDMGITHTLGDRLAGGLCEPFSILEAFLSVLCL